jgi:hypothetical protein
MKFEPSGATHIKPYFFSTKIANRRMGHHHDGAVVCHERRLLKFGWWLCAMDDGS